MWQHALVWIGAFGAGYAAEYYSEVWNFEYVDAIRGKYKNQSLAVMTAKVSRARKWGMRLFVLGLVDVASVLGGPWTFVAAALGSAFGAYSGIGAAILQKWERVNAGKDEDDD